MKTVKCIIAAIALLYFSQFETCCSAFSQTSATSNNSNDLTIKVNGISFTMKLVKGGTFNMGDDDPYHYSAGVLHSVTLSTFYMGETEVTQALWKAVMGSNPSCFKGDNLPVEKVSWNDCQEFIRKLNQLTGMDFRLPTEAEWEYAAGGGKNSHGYNYAGSNTLGNVAWYEDNSGDMTHAVKDKLPNELGLYDMSGNVNEWCNDWYDDYSASSQTNPKGPSEGTHRVLRGGDWFMGSGWCLVNSRISLEPDKKGASYGFRIALSQ